MKTYSNKIILLFLTFLLPSLLIAGIPLEEGVYTSRYFADDLKDNSDWAYLHENLTIERIGDGAVKASGYYIYQGPIYLPFSIVLTNKGNGVYSGTGSIDQDHYNFFTQNYRYRGYKIPVPIVRYSHKHTYKVGLTLIADSRIGAFWAKVNIPSSMGVYNCESKGNCDELSSFVAVNPLPFYLNNSYYLNFNEDEKTIPDADANGVIFNERSDFPNARYENLRLSVEIKHPHPKDLKIFIEAPDRKNAYVVHVGKYLQSGSSKYQTLSVSLATEDLTTIDGMWTLRIADSYKGSQGKVRLARLTLDVIGQEIAR